MRKNVKPANESVDSTIPEKRLRPPVTKRLMNDKFFNRLNSEVEFIYENTYTNKCIVTCRSCAKALNLSKSTVHLDITKRFSYLLYLKIPLEESGYKYLTESYFNAVKNVLKINSIEKAARGGEACKKVLIKRREESKL